MLNKKILAEKCIITGKVDDVSKVDIRLLRNHVLSSFPISNRVSQNEFVWQRDYTKVNYHQHIQWVMDYIRDHVRLEYGLNLIPTHKDSITGIIQQTGESIGTHQHIDAFDLHGSPDYSCLYCVSQGEQQSNVFFDYENGRRKMRGWKIPMEVGQFIIFNSDIPHRIDKNLNSDFLVNLSLKYQILD